MFPLEFPDVLAVIVGSWSRSSPKPVNALNAYESPKPKDRDAGPRVSG